MCYDGYAMAVLHESYTKRNVRLNISTTANGQADKVASPDQVNVAKSIGDEWQVVDGFVRDSNSCFYILRTGDQDAALSQSRVRP